MLTSVVRTLMLLGSLIITSLIPSFFPPDISGVWEIELHNEAASEQLIVSFHHNESVLSGSYIGSYQIRDLAGTVDGREVTFEYMIDGVRVLYVGRIVGKTLTGTYHAGMYDQGEFVGKKVQQVSL